MLKSYKVWRDLAEQFGIRLPASFYLFLEKDVPEDFGWSLLSAEEAVSLKAELDLRFHYPGREWRGVPFARSLTSEDLACFDLRTPPGQEAKVIPIRDWHGPRWEFSGDTKTFQQWLAQDFKGNLT